MTEENENITEAEPPKLNRGGRPSRAAKLQNLPDAVKWNLLRILESTKSTPNERIDAMRAFVALGVMPPSTDESPERPPETADTCPHCHASKESSVLLRQVLARIPAEQRPGLVLLTDRSDWMKSRMSDRDRLESEIYALEQRLAQLRNEFHDLVEMRPITPEPPLENTEPAIPPTAEVAPAPPPEAA